MDLASRLIWNLRIACWQNSTETVFWSNCKVQFWTFVIWQLFFSNHNVITDLLRRETTCTYFSVKSSREVHWIIMFQKDAVCLMVHPHHILTTLPLSTTPPACTLLSSLCQSLLPARPWHNLFPPIKPEWTCRFCTCALALTMAYIVRNHLGIY